MAEVIEQFPHRVQQIENCWIPLPDGCRLAARIWMPEDATTVPVPAIFEFIPYRKRDHTRNRDEPIHHYFAGHGYAAVRVDLRGSGDSDGLLGDEYTEQELTDAEQAIAWLAAQPWCDGNVGMMGISWGGFNALQVAARRPPALQAILTLCSTDDRYADDAHYMGGCLLNENLTWGSVLTMFSVMPPDPELVGERWLDLWRERLEGVSLFPARWMNHPLRDNYWRHGSVCEDYSAIQCPVYAMGGWADGYSNAIPRLLGGLQGPRKGLVGPWSHAFPHDGVPGPTIGFLQEALRWWDHWLKGIDTDIMAEPMYRVWLQESVPPLPFYDERPGRWVAEREWPSPRITSRHWHFARDRLLERSGQAAIVQTQSPQSVGLYAGEWCAFGVDGEMPLDQRADDGQSLRFTSDPLAQRLEVLGAPVVHLELEVDRPAAFVAVRLNDCPPEGPITRVSFGLLNLTHRNGHDRVEPLEPGRLYRVRVQLNDIAHAFPPGHSLRVAVSTAYWPMVWPSPEPVSLKLHTAHCRLELPVRPPDPEDETLPAFPPAEQGPPMPRMRLRAGRYLRKIERDLTNSEVSYRVYDDGGDFGGASLSRIADIDLELGYSISRRYLIRDFEPLAARAELTQTAEFRRDGWHVQLTCDTTVSGDVRDFFVQGTLTARLDGATLFTHTWEETVPRNGL